METKINYLLDTCILIDFLRGNDKMTLDEINTIIKSARMEHNQEFMEILDK